MSVCADMFAAAATATAFCLHLHLLLQLQRLSDGHLRACHTKNMVTNSENSLHNTFAATFQLSMEECTAKKLTCAGLCKGDARRSCPM